MPLHAIEEDGQEAARRGLLLGLAAGACCWALLVLRVLLVLGVFWPRLRVEEAHGPTGRPRGGDAPFDEAGGDARATLGRFWGGA